MSPESGEPPEWFRRALADRPVRGGVEVDGARISYRAWGSPGAPGVVLVHGGGAHSGWWDHIAPLLPGHRVVAPDLSGHGDSGHRESYDVDTWAREIIAVAHVEGLTRPMVVGHSLGGWATAAVGAQHGEAVAGVAIIDATLDQEPPEEVRLRARRRPRVYADREEAVRRFRVLPAQEGVLPFIAAHVARSSVRPVDGGWSWKFDPSFFQSPTVLRQLLPGMACPLTFFRCEHGLVPPEMVTAMTELSGVAMTVVELPVSGHHAMLDHPLALVAALRTLLATGPARDCGVHGTTT